MLSFAVALAAPVCMNDISTQISQLKTAARGPHAPFSSCIEDVEQLPASEVFRADDSRLMRDGLLVATKSSRRLMRFSKGRLTHCWRIGLGFTPEGHKREEGDGRTPIGWYATSDKPWSTFANAIAVHYPNAADAEAAHAEGRIDSRTRARIVAADRNDALPPQQTALGGEILIHGGGSTFNWTLGCIALDDEDLAALRETLPRGKRTQLLILP